MNYLNHTNCIAKALKRLIIITSSVLVCACTQPYQSSTVLPGTTSLQENASQLDPRLKGRFNKSEGAGSIRLNQLGYLPAAAKQFVYVVPSQGTPAKSFSVINSSGAIVHTGMTSISVFHPLSGEYLQTGDFSSLQQAGDDFTILVGNERSYPFAIDEDVYRQAYIGSAKSYTLQRASMELTPDVAGIFSRPKAHPDTEVEIHPSAKPQNAQLIGQNVSSPGGWYDAGDFNKYIINAAIASSQMMGLHELLPNVMDDSEMAIPESGNQVSDLLDEVRYELEWMLTMQDRDGGVFHKLTTLDFEKMILAVNATNKRYIVGKGTAATLDFAATMAQAARVYRDVDPQFAEDALAAAEGAWKWAKSNPDVAFKNPPDVKTGEYGDSDFQHEFFWAAAELLTATGDESYLAAVEQYYTPVAMRIGESWRLYLPNLGAYSLLHHAPVLPEALKNKLRGQLIKTATNIMQGLNQSPYSTSVDVFEWGSNSDVLNSLIVLANAHQLTEDRKYLAAMVKGLDYIYGRNGLGYSYVTGYGDKTPMKPHHRQSSADDILEPVPGLLSGGPNPKMQDRDWVDYQYSEPMRAWEDVEPSYSANEVCLNWNAPLVYVHGYIEMNKNKL